MSKCHIVGNHVVAQLFCSCLCSVSFSFGALGWSLSVIVAFPGQTRLLFKAYKKNCSKTSTKGLNLLQEVAKDWFTLNLF